jgi:hypothetical protein
MWKCFRLYFFLPYKSMAMLNKEEIIEKLKGNHYRLADMVTGLSEEEFSSALAGKWTPGQQLVHIYLSLRPLTIALGLPKIGLKAFGSANRPSRDYDSVVAKYHDALAAGGKAPSNFVPEPVLYKDKDAISEKLKANLIKLTSQLNKYSEKDLDKLLLPHPLLGKLTVREMLYFTIYHSEHHYKVTLKNLGKTEGGHLI